MLSVLAASFVSFSPTPQAITRHHHTPGVTGSCTAPSGRTSLLTAAASLPSEGHSNRRSLPAPALANALSRRAALLSGAAFAAGAGAPLAAWAGSDAAKARAQMESSKAALDDLLDRYVVDAVTLCDDG